MSLTLELIPEHGRPPTGAPERFHRATALKDLARARRRTVLKAIALGALTLGASVLEVGGSVLSAGKAWAESGPFGLQGWDNTHCRDAYPNGYDEVGDTSGLYVNTYAACFGGAFRGSDYCSAGWHMYGTFTQNDIQVDHVPISTACGGLVTKNSWRWTTIDGHVYRCSDGFSTYWGGGMNGVTFLTICRAGII